MYFKRDHTDNCTYNFLNSEYANLYISIVLCVRQYTTYAPA